MTNSNNAVDRRKIVALREMIIPLVTAVVVGIASSFLTTYVAVNTLQLKVQYLEKSVDTLTQLVKDVNVNQLQISKVEMRVDDQSRRFDKIEEKFDRLERKL